MVLKTAEGISGIAEESPWVNRFVAQKRFLLRSWQAGASQPCRPLACAVTHGAFSANTCVLGLLVESVVASLASVLMLTLLQGSRAAQLAARPCWRRLGVSWEICISPIVRAHVFIGLPLHCSPCGYWIYR